MLEIGCGTGQAILPLARLGYEVTAVGLGADLAGVARRNIAGFADAYVIVGAFENWPLPSAKLSLVPCGHDHQPIHNPAGARLPR